MEFRKKTYYYWQRKVFNAITERQKPYFAEIPVERRHNRSEVSVTVRIGDVEADIYTGADHATIEAVFAFIEVMLSDFTGAERIYIACGYTDLRQGIDGLAGIVQQSFNLDPFTNTNTLFLFCGRRRGPNKGAVLGRKRLCSFCIRDLKAVASNGPRTGDEARSLTQQQYRWLMEGLSVEQPKAAPSGNRFEYGFKKC